MGYCCKQISNLTYIVLIRNSKHNAVGALIPLLDPTNSNEILEQAVWVLGNMACESVSSRDTILRSGVLDPLVDCLRAGIESVRPCSSIHIVFKHTYTYSHLVTHPLNNKFTKVIKTLFDGKSEYTCETLIAATKGRDIALTKNEFLSFMRIGAWTLSNLCDGQPRPVLDSSR